MPDTQGMSASPASEPAPTVEPLDLWCTTCGTSPGCRCVWRKPDGSYASRFPHAARVTAARTAAFAARRERRRQSA